MQSSEFQRLVRLANRITYGANRQFLQIAKTLGYRGFLEWQLDQDQFDDSELEDLLSQFLPTLNMDAQTLFEYVVEQENFGIPARDLIIATMIRRTYSPRQLYERMVEFWSDHFSVPISEVILAMFKIVEDRELIRRHALGRFEALLQGNAQSPAMLYYLDNFNNTVEGPNENYARELMELHTLGVNGGYTEDDIKEVARVFTGWSIVPPGRFMFNPAAHDWQSKQVLGHEIEPVGTGEGHLVLELLAEHPSTAEFMATKLARRFFTDDPEPELIEAVADAFTGSSGDIPTTLRTLMTHPVVTTTAAIKFKRPNEFVIGLARALETELTEQSLLAVFQSLETAGQIPFGWPAPDGFADQREYWQSTNGLLMRFNTSSAWTELLDEQSALLSEAAAIIDSAQQVDFLTRALRPQGIEPASRRILLRHVRRLQPEQRPHAVAAFLMAGPEAQWR